MSLETDIVQQLQELRKWQQKQQEELILRQEEQREKLNDQQNRMFEALSISIDNMNLDEQSLKKLIEDHKEKEQTNLIDFDTPLEESITPQKQTNFHHYSNNSSLRNNNNESSFSTRSESQLSMRDDMPSYDSDKSQKSILIDDLPVPSPKKDFVALLEEKLKESDIVEVETRTKPVVKKSFLRKGQGLARFMPNPNANKTPKCTSRSRSGSFSSGISPKTTKTFKSPNPGKCNTLPKSKKVTPQKSVSPQPKKITPKRSSSPQVKKISLQKSVSPLPNVAQPKLTLKNIPPPQKKIQQKTISPKVNFEKKKPTIVVNEPDNSTLDTKTKQELEEVRIFELLEDKAENSSFCSTSSTVIAFLQQSTPLKHKALLHSASKHQISLNDIGDETLEDIVSNTQTNNLLLPQKNIQNKNVSQYDALSILKLKNKINNNNDEVTEAVLPYGTDIDVHYDNNSNQESNLDESNVSLHVRFAEYNEYKTMSDNSYVSSDAETVTDYLEEKGAWSDNSVTPESSDVESVSSLLEIDNKRNLKNGIPSISRIEADDSDIDESHTFKNGIENEKGYEEERSEDEYEKGNETKNTTITSEDTVIENNKYEDISMFKSENLKATLLKLQEEIKTFRQQSAALVAQKEKLQEERINLQDERIKMQRSLKEKEATLDVEKKKMESILQEEKKRLAREKAALESRMRDAHEKTLKSKQERQEIQTLREQLDELKEEYIQKESKWSATAARQRSQIRVLQAENARLKQELEKLQQKQAARFKKTVCSNTKAIHQINKFLADRKKASSFPKTEETAIHDDQPRRSYSAVDDNHNAELDAADEKPNERQEKEPKVLKSVDIIARTRKLYESLLKDATDELREAPVVRRNLLNQSLEAQEQIPEDYYSATEADEEEPYTGEAMVEEQESKSIETRVINTKSSEQQEPEQCHEDEIHKTEQVKVRDNKQGIKEVRHTDGRIEYWYPNGNVKKVFPDKGITKMIYYNGDVKETDQNGTVKYFYASTRTWHMTMPDGLEIIDFPDGQTERRSKDGTVEVVFPDGSIKVVLADGSEKWTMRDGTVAETTADGERILTFPNGQREIHTNDHKRREYPDGTIKLVYPDGTQETRYANGRVRIKDKDGNLLMDTHQ